MIALLIFAFILGTTLAQDLSPAECHSKWKQCMDDGFPFANENACDKKILKNFNCVLERKEAKRGRSFVREEISTERPRKHQKAPEASSERLTREKLESEEKQSEEKQANRKENNKFAVNWGVGIKKKVRADNFDKFGSEMKPLPKI